MNGDAGVKAVSYIGVRIVVYVRIILVVWALIAGLGVVGNTVLLGVHVGLVFGVVKPGVLVVLGLLPVAVEGLRGKESLVCL